MGVAVPEWAADLGSGAVLDYPGGGMSMDLEPGSRTMVVLTGAQSGRISQLRINADGCDVEVFGGLLIEQSIPIDPYVTVVAQQAWTEGLFEQLACDTSGVCTAGAPSDFNGEVWVLTR